MAADPQPDVRALLASIEAALAGMLRLDVEARNVALHQELARGEQAAGREVWRELGRGAGKQAGGAGSGGSA